MTQVLSGLFLAGIIGGYCFGWWWRGRHERHLDREALERIGDDQRAVARMALPQRNVWAEEHGKITGAGGPVDIPYEEQAPMFMDQFLLRYFYHVVQPIDFTAKGRPWELFVEKNPWAKETPALFQRHTSIQLTDMQLNGAVADYMSRVGKLQEKGS